jgi:hypothetical protein
MRILDFIIQTLLLFAALFALAFGKEGVIAITFIQFFVGSWQLLSAIITVSLKDHGNPYRRKTIRLYWLLVLIYFVVLALVAITQIEFLIGIWFFSAWILAIYYYIFTIRLTFINDKEKTSMWQIK